MQARMTYFERWGGAVTKAAFLPGRTVQQEAIWPVEVPFRASVMALPGLLKGKHLPFNVPLCCISGLLLAAHKIIVVLSQCCPVPAQHSVDESDFSACWKQPKLAIVGH